LTKNINVYTTMFEQKTKCESVRCGHDTPKLAIQ